MDAGRAIFHADEGKNTPRITPFRNESLRCHQAGNAGEEPDEACPQETRFSRSGFTMTMLPAIMTTASTPKISPGQKSLRAIVGEDPEKDPRHRWRQSLSRAPIIPLSPMDSSKTMRI
jgi:hypothetical protein